MLAVNSSTASQLTAIAVGIISKSDSGNDEFIYPSIVSAERIVKPAAMPAHITKCRSTGNLSIKASFIPSYPFLCPERFSRHTASKTAITKKTAAKIKYLLVSMESYIRFANAISSLPLISSSSTQQI